MSSIANPNGFTIIISRGFRRPGWRATATSAISPSILRASVEQDKGEPYGLFAEEPLKRFYEYQHRLGNIFIEDQDDYYRLGSLLRRLGRPVSLEKTATDGLVEDFYGAWNFADPENVGNYTPEHWGLILNL